MIAKRIGHADATPQQNGECRDALEGVANLHAGSNIPIPVLRIARLVYVGLPNPEKPIDEHGASPVELHHILLSDQADTLVRHTVHNLPDGPEAFLATGYFAADAGCMTIQCLEGLDPAQDARLRLVLSPDSHPHRLFTDPSKAARAKTWRILESTLGGLAVVTVTGLEASQPPEVLVGV